MLFKDKAVIHLESVDSTNNYAASLLKLSRPPEGTVITAQEQTAGKGQRGAVWQSESGENLLLSVILYPPFTASDELFSLNQCISLALCDTIEELTGIDSFIKWPNDIFVDSRKVAGILIEFAWTESKLQSAICGIGVNLNQLHFDLPHAASLRQLTNRKYDSAECLEVFQSHLQREYVRLLSGKANTISQHYLNRIFRLHQPSRYTWRSTEIIATIIGVDRGGLLRLHHQDGTEFLCDLKEISMVLG